MANNPISMNKVRQILRLHTQGYKKLQIAPRDKALVENAVRIIYSRIYAKVREKEHFTLEELNASIRIALEEHNNTLLTGRNYSRLQQFIEVERDALQPLPALRYELKKQAYVTVMKNGHVSLAVDKHYYSVPYRYIGKKVKLMYSRHTIEVYYNSRSIIDNQEFMLRLSISKRTAARWRITGKIPYIIIGKKTYYLVQDVGSLLQGTYVRHRAPKAFAKQIDDAAA